MVDINAEKKRISELEELPIGQFAGDEYFPITKTVDVSGVPTAKTFKVKPPYAPTLIAESLESANDYTDSAINKLGLFQGSVHNVVGGSGVDETDNILAAINACGLGGGGTVIIRSANGTDPIYINKSIQIEWSNLTLIYDCSLLYGPLATQRINGGLAEVIRTELGQVSQVKLRADTTVDGEGRMVLPVRVGDGAFLKVGDRITVRGENDVFGKALTKQVTTVVAITGDNVTCLDEPEETFKAVYPESEWPSDWTTGTTVAINVYTEMTVDANPNDYTVQVVDSSEFSVGDLAYISDIRTEKDLMAPVVTSLKSAAVMEIARIVEKTPTSITFDKALRRNYQIAWGACVVKMDPVVNSHIITRDIKWDAPQPDRRNAALAINYGDRCTISSNKMDGKAGRKGIGVRVAYSYNSHVRNSNVFDAYSFESAEGYGIALYYSTLCSMNDNMASGCRHNFLFQTTTSCDAFNNDSNDDYISGIDLHGANSVDTRIMFNRVSRSNRYAPGVTNGGAIRNGNTSHTIGDHNTLIAYNRIEGYTGEKCAAIDISPSSHDVIVKHNDIVDCTIGVRHYNVGSGIDPAQYVNRLTIDGNDFTRVVEPTYIRNWTNSIWSMLVFTNNKSIGNSKHFKIQDVPSVLAFGNMVLDPVALAEEYALDFENVANLRVFGNVASTANRGVRVVNCGNVKVIRNYLSDVTESGFKIYQTGNTSFIEASNDDTGGGGGGTPVEFNTSVTHIQWRNVGDTEWIDLVSLESLSGTDGTNGKEVEFQTTATHIQWKYTIDPTWTNLVQLSDLLGAPTDKLYQHFIVPLGDSRSAQNWTYTNTTPALLARSPLFVAEQLSRRCRVISRWRQGVSGDEVDQIWDRIQNNTLNDAGIGPNDVPKGVTWFFLAGTNNASGATDKAYMDAVLAKHKQIVQWAVDRGDKVIISAEWPRVASSSPSGTLTANEQKLFQYYVRQIKKQYLGMPNVKITDVWPEAVDPTSTTTDAIANLLNPDGLHNSIGIAYLEGKKITQALIDWDYPIIYYPTASNADYYDAALNPRGNLMANPMMKGTTGTLSTNATGVAPDGWTMDASSGLSVVGSRETIIVNGVQKDAFKMVISGTTSATGAYARLRRSGLISTIAGNDVVEAGCEVLVANGHVNYNAVGIVIDPGVTNDQVHGGVNLGGTNADNPFPASLVESFYACPRSPQYAVPSTPPASLALDFRVRFSQSGVASSATIYFISSSFRKTTLDG